MSNPNATTLDQAIQMRDAWLAALTALATAQSYTITTAGVQRILTRANLAEAQKQYLFWEGRVKALTPGQGRVRFGVPL